MLNLEQQQQQQQNIRKKMIFLYSPKIDRWTMEWGSWHCTEDRDQDHPHGKEMQKSKMAVWGGLTNSSEKKTSEKQGRKGKI